MSDKRSITVYLLPTSEAAWTSIANIAMWICMGWMVASIASCVAEPFTPPETPAKE